MKKLFLLGTLFLCSCGGTENDIINSGTEKSTLTKEECCELINNSLSELYSNRFSQNTNLKVVVSDGTQPIDFNVTSTIDADYANSFVYEKTTSTIPKEYNMGESLNNTTYTKKVNDLIYAYSITDLSETSKDKSYTISFYEKQEFKSVDLSKYNMEGSHCFDGNLIDSKSIEIDVSDPVILNELLNLNLDPNMVKDIKGSINLVFDFDKIKQISINNVSFTVEDTTPMYFTITGLVNMSDKILIDESTLSYSDFKLSQSIIDGTYFIDNQTLTIDGSEFYFEEDIFITSMGEVKEIDGYNYQLIEDGIVKYIVTYDKEVKITKA